MINTAVDTTTSTSSNGNQVFSPSNSISALSRTENIWSADVDSPKQKREKIKQTKRWGCSMCLSRKNLSTATVCTTCGAPKPISRIGILSSHGAFFLCKTDTSTALPTVSIFCVSGSNEEAVTAMKLSAHHHKVILPMRGEKTVEECCKEAIDNLVNYNDPEDDTFENYDLHKSKILHEKKESTNIESVSALGPEWTRNESKTLFDQVMESAKEISYDASIGRYLHKDVAAQMEEKELLHENMNYTKFMLREKVEMGKNVTEILKRRNNSDIYYDFEPPPRDEERHHCALCEMAFPISQLLASITFKAVSDWRDKRNASFPSNDIRLSALRIHDKALLCLFCTQFFDKDFSDVVDESEIEDSVGFGKSSGIEGGFHYSNKTYKRIMKKMIEKQDQLDDRPLSRMKLKLSIDRIKFKAESGNADLRFQYNPQALKKDLAKPIVDQAKGGRLLRDKYSDLGVLLTEQKKGQIAQLESEKRMSNVLQKNTTMASQNKLIQPRKTVGALPKIDPKVGIDAKIPLRNSKSAELPKVSNENKLMTMSVSSADTKKSKRKKRIKKKKMKKDKKLDTGSVSEADKASVTSKNSKVNKGARVRKPLILIVPDKESANGQKRLEIGVKSKQVDTKGQDKYKSSSVSPSKKENAKKVNFSDNTNDNSSTFSKSASVEFSSPPQQQHHQMQKEKKFNWKQKLQKEAESRQPNKVQTLDGLSKIGKSISDYSNQQIKKKTMIKSNSKSKVKLMPVRVVEYDIESEGYEEYYDGDFEVINALDNDNETPRHIISLPFWGGESLEIEDEAVDEYDEDFSIESYAWATKDTLKQDSSRNDVYTPIEDDPRIASLRLLSRGSTRSSHERSVTPKIRKGQEQFNTMQVLSTGAASKEYKPIINKKIQRLKAESH